MLYERITLKKKRKCLPIDWQQYRYDVHVLRKDGSWVHVIFISMGFRDLLVFWVQERL